MSEEEINLWSDKNAELVVEAVNNFGEVKSLQIELLDEMLENQHFMIWSARKYLLVKVYKPYLIVIGFDGGYSWMTHGEIEKFYDTLTAEFVAYNRRVVVCLDQVLEKRGNIENGE